MGGRERGLYSLSLWSLYNRVLKVLQLKLFLYFLLCWSVYDLSNRGNVYSRMRIYVTTMLAQLVWRARIISHEQMVLLTACTPFRVNLISPSVKSHYILRLFLIIMI